MQSLTSCRYPYEYRFKHARSSTLVIVILPSFVQVSLSDNEYYFRLIDSFYQLTKTPLLFNTSFNLSGEPLVETPEDAIDTFEYSAIDYLYFPEVQKLRGK